MKKIYYEIGPDVITNGTGVNEIRMRRGEPVEVSDERAASMLTNPMFKEQKTEARSQKTDKSEKP